MENTMRRAWLSFLQWAWRSLYTAAYRKTGMTQGEWLTRGSRVICVDLDGVIAEETIDLDGSTSWEAYYAAKAPMEGAREALESLLLKGWLVVICTSRLSPLDEEVTRRWLRRYDIHYSHLVFNKPFACCYVDDNAVEFMGWHDVFRRLSLVK